MTWSEGVIFNFNKLESGYIWTEGRTVDGPFYSAELMGWNEDYVIPVTGFELIKHVESFRINSEPIAIDKFKLCKKFKPDSYKLTKKENEWHTSNDNLVKSLRDLAKSKSITSAKWFMVDHFHNATPIGKNVNCATCGNFISSGYFINECFPPPWCELPSTFTQFDIAWLCYLNHLSFNDIQICSYNNILIDLKFFEDVN